MKPLRAARLTALDAKGTVVGSDSTYFHQVVRATTRATGLLARCDDAVLVTVEVNGTIIDTIRRSKT